MPDGPSAYDRALRLLATRSHFRRELADKLARRGYGSDEVEAALARVGELGYLDDAATAREFVRTRLARGGLGARRLRHELERRGVDSAVAREAIAEHLPEDDLAAAREAAERWRARTRRPNPASLGRHLERKGFSRRAVVTLVRELEGEAE